MDKIHFFRIRNSGISQLTVVGSHAHANALLQSTVLTPISMVLGHLAVLACPTNIIQLLSDASLKETFAALAGNCVIVASCESGSEKKETGPSLIAMDSILTKQKRTKKNFIGTTKGKEREPTRSLVSADDANVERLLARVQRLTADRIGRLIRGADRCGPIIGH